MITISLGKCVSQTRNPKESKFVWVRTTILHIQFLVHEEQVERKKENWDLVHPWRVNSRACWSVFGANWSWKIEEPSCWYFFLATNSFEFPAERFLVTCARIILIKKWMPEELRSMKGYIHWVGQVKRMRVGGK